MVTLAFTIAGNGHWKFSEDNIFQKIASISFCLFGNYKDFCFCKSSCFTSLYAFNYSEVKVFFVVFATLANNWGSNHMFWEK